MAGGDDDRGPRQAVPSAATAGAPRRRRAQPQTQQQQQRLRILCLHGSRQTGEIFAARLRQIRRKLEAVADLVFVDAPHPAPRGDDAADADADADDAGAARAGASSSTAPAVVLGRAFWRHWNLAPSSTADCPQPSSPRSHAALPSARERAAAVEAQLVAGGWADVVVGDWRHSLLHIEAVLMGRRDPGEAALGTLADEEAAAAEAARRPPPAAASSRLFDGVLGFSNGAAAAGLLAAHAAARAASGCPVYGALRFFVLAGGYVAEPRGRLVEAGLGGGGGGPPAPPAPPPPLPFASLHCIGEADPAIAVEDSLALAGLFEPARRRVLRHGGGHHFPQRAEHAGEVLAFLRGMLLDGGGADEEPPPMPPPPPPMPPPPPPPPTEEQLQEMEALEAIYGADSTNQYRPVSLRPPRFVVRLSPPPPPASTDAGGGAAAAALAAPAAAPTSALFSLRFTLPPGYPTSEPPAVEIEGPLGGPADPHRAAMAAALVGALAREAEAAAGGGGGYTYQVVEAMREWADASLPADIAERRPGGGGKGGPTPEGAAGAAGAAAGDGAGGGERYGDASAAAWWEEDETDKSLMRWAMARVAAEPWRTPWMQPHQHEQQQQQQQHPPPHPQHLPHQHALAHRLSGGRGRWDVVVGLVGKPSAGKSTLFNALTDPPHGGAEEAKEGSFPFTTIAPNTGRGYALLPCPAIAMGLLAAGDCRPAHGYARGFDLAALERATVGEGQEGGDIVRAHNVAPLRAMLDATAPASAASAAAPHSHHPHHAHDDGAAGGAGGAEGSSNAAAALTSPNSCAAAAASAAAPRAGWPPLWRRVPVTVRDVAGLVPGAYAGKGRGNAFLGDLCDADVLVHVVDVSGTTTAEGALTVAAAAAGGREEEQQEQQDEKGAAAAAADGDGKKTTTAMEKKEGEEASGASDPRYDVTWVAEEIHLWIYTNVRAKWGTVRRRPHRLPELFSGYQATRALVEAALRHAGVPPALLALSSAASAGTSAAAEAAAAASELGRWTARELHLLVATFVAVRFPTLLALNKADVPGALARVAAVRSAFPREAAVAVSARAERWLLARRRAGEVEYGADNGPARAVAAAVAAGPVEEGLRRLDATTAELGGGTGAAAVLATAVALRAPSFFLPVGDRQTCAAIAVGGRGGAGGGSEAKARAAEGREAGVLRDCVLMRPGSTVQDAFEALKRPPLGLLAGDFVRAEAAVATVAMPRAAVGAAAAPRAVAHGDDGGAAAARRGLAWRVVRKEEVLSPECCVLYVQTTRRSTWQAAARQRQQQQQQHQEGEEEGEGGGGGGGER